MADSDAPARGEVPVRVLKYAAPALLTFVAFIQLYLGNVHHLSAWKGGGFGMFSTVDGPSNRSIRVYLVTAEGELPTREPRWLGRRSRYIRTFPTKWRIRAMAEELARSTWVDRSAPAPEAPGEESEPAAGGDDRSSVAGGEPTPLTDAPRERPQVRESMDPEPERDDDRRRKLRALRSGQDPKDKVVVPVEAVRIEIWKTLFRAETEELYLTKLMEHTTRVDEVSRP